MINDRLARIGDYPFDRLRSDKALVIVALSTSGDSQLTELERIQARGSLVMLTVNGASTYYLGSEGETGFEYELALEFARHLKLPLEVLPVSGVGQLIPALNSGRGDFIAANLTQTPERSDRSKRSRDSRILRRLRPRDRQRR